MIQVSVIVPTFNRYASLRVLLSALLKQTIAPNDFEVIVVDDGSSDETPSLTQIAYPFSLHYRRQANAGSGAARNAGARLSQGKVLVFLDDDILPEPGYLQALVDEHARFPNVIGMGTLYPYVDQTSGPFERYSRAVAGQTLTNGFVDFTTCTSNNLSVERQTFFQLGAWRDIAGDGQTLWGDVEFGYRAYRAGLRFRRCAEAVCFHRDYAIRDLRTASRRMQRSAQLAHLLFQTCPELEGELRMFRDMSPPDWRRDAPSLIVRKFLRALSATEVVVNSETALVSALERATPSPRVLGPFYRWIIGAYIFRGYRDGLTTRQLASVPV
ncbi:MAG TPA: glycosyltransferase family 2 protein [Chloroflexota bacterium]|nr:glycosyltransferase family 2 protein [Chloroflexota bacterium]